MGGAEKASEGAGTCLLRCGLLTWSVKGEGSLGYGTFLSRASVSLSVRWVECDPCPHRTDPAESAEVKHLAHGSCWWLPFLEHPLYAT